MQISKMPQKMKKGGTSILERGLLAKTIRRFKMESESMGYTGLDFLVITLASLTTLQKIGRVMIRPQGQSSRC